jgi:hypothetical protein
MQVLGCVLAWLRAAAAQICGAQACAPQTLLLFVLHEFTSL